MKRIAALTLCLLLICLSATDVYAREDYFAVPEFASLDEYEYFVADTPLPLDFVHVSQLSLFGDFKHCLIDQSFYTQPISSYTYTLSSGIKIKIDHNTTGVAPGMTHQDHLPDGVTTLMKASKPGSNSFCYFRNGVYYIYHSGKLNTVAWFAGRTLFQIPITGTDLEAYASIPVLAKLLSLSEEESDAAIGEICQALGMRLQKTHFQIRNDRIQALIQALFIVPLPAFLIIRWIVNKRRKAKGIAIRRARGSKETHPSFSNFVNHESPFDTPNSH